MAVEGARGAAVHFENQISALKATSHLTYFISGKLRVSCYAQLLLQCYYYRHPLSSVTRRASLLQFTPACQRL